jgi:hypothetical protein
MVQVWFYCDEPGCEVRAEQMQRLVPRTEQKMLRVGVRAITATYRDDLVVSTELPEGWSGCLDGEARIYCPQHPQSNSR